MLGGILAVAGAVAALWLIREDEIERETPIEVEPRFVRRAGARARGR